MLQRLLKNLAYKLLYLLQSPALDTKVNFNKTKRYSTLGSTDIFPIYHICKETPNKNVWWNTNKIRNFWQCPMELSINKDMREKMKNDYFQGYKSSATYAVQLFMV